jgi:hypothetical protein
MIVRAGQPFTLRGVFDRFGVASIQRRVRDYCRPRLRSRTYDFFGTFGVWSLLADLAGRSEFLSLDRSEQFRRFCRDCREDTAHEGFDELGLGWYVQISRCRHCGRQGMKVWSLA